MQTAIIGVGNVGSAIASGLIMKGLPFMEKLLLVDIDQKRLDSEYLEFLSMKRILRTNIEIEKSTQHIPKADLYIIAAGKKDNWEKSSRDEIYEQNRAIVEPMLKKIAELDNEAVVIMVTNPSGELSKLAHDYVSHVIAAGNRLDNARHKDSHLYGKHEKPVDYFRSITHEKGYTNWGIAAEVVETAIGLQCGVFG